MIYNKFREVPAVALPTLACLGISTRFLAIWFVGLMITGFSGCLCISDAKPFVDDRPFVSSYHNDLPDAPIRRVAILPIGCRGRDSAMATAIQESLAHELRSRGLFEVVELDARDLNCRTDIVKSGRYNEKQLVEMRNRFNVDAVVFAKINRYRAYRPANIDVIAHVVDTRDSAVVVSIDGGWDTKKQGDAKRLRAFIEANYTDYRSVELAMQSPMVLASFVAQEMASRF